LLSAFWTKANKAEFLITDDLSANDPKRPSAQIHTQADSKGRPSSIFGTKIYSKVPCQILLTATGADEILFAGCQILGISIMKAKMILMRAIRMLASRSAIVTALITFIPAIGFPGYAAYASVIYSNFGAGNSYSCCQGWGVFGGSFGSGADAMSFTPTAAADVSQIDLPLNTFIGNSAGVTISLWTNVGGDLGAQLGSWSATLPDSGLLTISGISGVHLDALASYYLAASESGSAIDDWNWNSVGATGPYINAGTSNASGTLGAFDVLAADVSTTPLPSTWLMLLGGFVGLGFFAYRGTKKRTALAAA
jgi:hypothetical protein